MKPKRKVPDSSAPYATLTPDCILDALTAAGLDCDGRIQALNSFENRVYQAWLNDGASVVAKFYRPRRWSRAAILEEHTFAADLADAEVPVVAPLTLRERTLHEHSGFLFAVYPRRGGRTPELEDEDTLRQLGRLTARIHAVGALDDFEHRPSIGVREFGETPVRDVLASGFVPPDLRVAYETTARDVIGRIAARWFPVRTLRLHGDSHAGNILWTDAGAHFVDLDDARMGPAVQDLWMWLSGEREARQRQLAVVVAGYREFLEFNEDELALIEPLRTLRIIHHAGWLAQRWQDPAFPQAFPYFNTQRYWQDHILALREQAAALEEPPLELDTF